MILLDAQPISTVLLVSTAAFLLLIILLVIILLIAKAKLLPSGEVELNVNNDEDHQIGRASCRERV